MKKIILLLVIPFLFSCMSGPAVDEEPPVLNDMTAWADFNGDGYFQENELTDLYMTAMHSLRGEHEAESPVDPFIDRNDDGFIDQEEIEIFAAEVFVLPVFNLYERIPHLAWIVDTDDDGQINRREAQRVHNFMFNEGPDNVEPGPVRGPVAEEFDKNGDGFFDTPEIEEARAIFFLSFLIYATVGGERMEVLTFLDELSDINEDGFLDRTEIDMRNESLEGPHDVMNPIDERIDFNRNGFVDAFEIEEALDADRQELGAGEALPVITRVDFILDLNKDDFITEDEIIEILESYLQGPGDVTDDRLFGEFFDVEKDGFISESDLFMFREMIFIPHPVIEEFDFDRTLDEDDDGFVSPEEIGVAAGFSPEVPLLSFDERLERMRWERPEPIVFHDEGPREETEAGPSQGDEKHAEDAPPMDNRGRTESARKKLEQIKGKSLAIVNINIATSNVDSETAAGISLFMENAFVNLGYASVMDRNNLDSLLKEQNFQLSSVVDEDTALEAGKIAGLDFIVVGSISYVGEKYYLNVKCLNVETGEIFGSSIAEADSQNNFFSMTNVAVGKFF